MSKGGSKLLKKEVEAIAKKLGAEIKSGGNHLKALIRYNNETIAYFGIRHDKKARHGHVPAQLHISSDQAYKMATCHISRDEYFSILKTKGIIK